MNIIITGDNTIKIDGAEHKIIHGEAFSPAYPDFEPRVLDKRDEETNGLIVEFGHNRLTNVNGTLEQVIVRSCDRFVVVPIEE